MKRNEFEHTIRAAGAILGVNEVLVIGSQAIHASINFEIEVAQRSIEADISALEDNDGRKSDLIDASIGELSAFQETFGYYAQGVTPKTAVLPTGWRDRLIPFCTPQTQGVTAHCLELHDLWISKAIAGRPKDIEFCTALTKMGLLKSETLQARLKGVRGLKSETRAAVLSLIY